jgi:transcriptional regulator with XRE-family HTH domain
MGSFGRAVLAAREARGWTQRDLAIQVGVSQRAVSSWERGVSEPHEETKRAVSELLHLQPGSTSPPSALRSPSGGALLAELPFEDLEPGEFEDFAVTLARCLYPGGEAYRQGKSGHTQHGFDVVVECDGKVLVGIQCKRAQRFGPKEIGKAVAAATMEVDAAYIFLSRVASPDARNALRGHRGWQLWDKNKLSHAVHDLPRDRALPLVDRYFPLLREKFLGIRLPGPWLEPAQYFSQMSRSERSSHQWMLVGRGRMLEDLVQFATGSPGQVGVLVGRGGTGKTKMLHSLCARMPADEVSVRFLERDPVIDHQAFEQLPAGRLLVVVDDAHDEEAPVGKVVRGVLSANPRANVLLALRPDGEFRTRCQLREAGLDPQQSVWWELADLAQLEAETLARAVLGLQHSYAAPRLAGATRDCPFLLVTGALLVRDGLVELQRFEGDDRLRRELIESLADTISAGATDQPEVRREVLRAVSALQPMRTADKDFRNALEELTGRVFDQLVPHLSAWEDSGILLRRGETYRVVPDLLGDALLARAGCARDTGTSTGYLDRVHRVVSGPAMGNLLVNASRIDWQEPPVRRGHLVASLWDAVRAELQTGDAATRAAVLDVLAKVAFYQPRLTLEIVRWALEHPTASTQVDAGHGLTFTYTDQEVRDAVGPVLRNAAYDPEVFPEAADLLWELARSDARPPNQHPNHALRMFSDLARFDPRGVTLYQRSLPTLVERWLRRPQRDTDVHDPLLVLHPLLAPEGHQQTWSAEALTFHPFVINPDAPPVADLRRQVLDLAFEQMRSPNPRRAVAAVKTIGAGLSAPLGGFGLQVTEQQRGPWSKHFQETLVRLHKAVRFHPPTPVTSAALREQLQWPAEHGASEIYHQSREVLAALPRHPEHELARGLRGGPIDPPSDSEATFDYLDRQRADEQFLAACAAAVADWPDAKIVQFIERLLDELRLALGDDSGRARPFAWALVSSRPSLGEALCARVRDTPGTTLATLVSVTLSALAQLRNPCAVVIANQLLDTKDVGLARQVAHAFGIQRGRADLLHGEPMLLRTLVEHPDAVVVAAAAGAARFLDAQHRDLAVELLTRPLARRSRGTLGEFTWAFGPHGKLAWPDLAQRHKDAFLDALCAAESIESYEIATFLAMLSVSDPHSVIDLLTARVEVAETGSISTGTLPHHWSVPLRFRDRDDFPDLLRRVREWLAAAPDSPWRRYWGSRLFAAVAGPYDAQTRQVIEEYLSEPDSNKIKTVRTMLRDAPRTLVWDADFVRRCLRAADMCGADDLAAVQSALYSAVFTGGRSAAIGEPFPQDVEQRDVAAQLAARAVPGSVEEQFYKALLQSAQMWIDRALSEMTLPTDGRDW